MVDALWYIQDIAISIATVAVIPLCLWWISAKVRIALPRALQFAGYSMSLFCITTGMAHLNWAYMPVSIPSSVFVLHAGATVGSVVFAIALFATREKLVEAINELAIESGDRMMDTTIRELRELGDRITQKENTSDRQ